MTDFNDAEEQAHWATMGMGELSDTVPVTEVAEIIVNSVGLVRVMLNGETVVHARARLVKMDDPVRGFEIVYESK